MWVWRALAFSCLLFVLAPALRIKRADQSTNMAKGVDIYNLHVTSDIRHRFATTLVTSRVANTDNEAREVEFYMQLPNEAFIANYSMEINGEIKVGEVKEKKKADAEYDAAKQRGHTAARVSAKPREANSFALSVNVAANSKATFNLTYIEFLVRKLGRYEHTINISPGQVVHDLRVKVKINETRKITHLRVPKVRKDFGSSYLDGKEENELAMIYRPADNTAEVTFEPTVEEQKNFSDSGIVGQLAVQYDVTRGMDGGEVEVIDGYFVHYFAPKGLEPMNKDVIFVLDTSGSMSGRKMEQVRTSMNIILKDLKEEDRFNLIDFDSNLNVWRHNTLVPVRNETITEALTFAANLEASGGTDINDALLKAIELLHHHSSERGRVPIIIFLTDGQPTSGVSNTDDILKNVKTKNERSISIYSLGFGRGVDFGFLKKISLQSGAVARKIYEESDAALQLEGFYNEVATPLLTNVTFTYLGNDIEASNVTRSIFPTYYDGCEFAVAGRITSGSDLTAVSLMPQVTASSGQGQKVFSDVISLPCWGACYPRPPIEPTISPENVASQVGFTERLWAYLTIKELLRQKDAATETSVKTEVTQKALQMSLKYHFVTSLTSMIVVQDEETKSSALDVLEREDSARRTSGRSNFMSGGSPLAAAYGGRLAGMGPSSSMLYHSPPGYPMALMSSSYLPSRPPASRLHSYIVSDPHVLVKIGQVPVCFDLEGGSGDTFLLFEDNEMGVKLSGLLTKPWPESNQTFFTTMSLEFKGLQITTKAENGKQLETKIMGNNPVARKYFKLKHKNGEIVLKFKNGLRLRIQLGKSHAAGHKKQAFLGVFVEGGRRYTGACSPPRFSGIIGQFTCYSAAVKTAGKSSQLMVFDGFGFKKQVSVNRSVRYNSESHHRDKCWHVANSGLGLMKGHALKSFRQAHQV